MTSEGGEEDVGGADLVDSPEMEGKPLEFIAGRDPERHAVTTHVHMSHSLV